MKPLALALLLLFSASPYAQEPKNANEAMDALAKDLSALHKDVEALNPKPWVYMPGKLRIVRSDVPIYKGADTKSGVLAKLPEGQTLPVVDKAGDWYAVTLGNDSGARRTGWVQASSAAPESVPYATPGIGADDIYQALVDKVKQMQVKYSANPYVRMTGFTVEISVPPSVNLEFEFK